MNPSYSIRNGWLLFCLGIFAAAAFCMKWMEADLLVTGGKFTVIGLELSYSKEHIQEIFSSMDPVVRTVLGYHLTFDFVFMAGVYPGIALLCLMARKRVSAGYLRKALFFIALLQAFAWAADIVENLYLLCWMKEPIIESGFGSYHIAVYLKWVIALLGVFLSVPILIFRRKPVTSIK